MDGLEFLQERQRRGVGQGVPVLMLTADMTNAQVAAAMDAGAQGYLSKPFTVGEIRECVGRVREGSCARELVG
jgi:DNA-binding response OmpR family regulator